MNGTDIPQVDQWGEAVAAGSVSSVEAWNAALMDHLHSEAQAFSILAEPSETDEEFVLGSVFCGLYRVLGGSAPTAPRVIEDLDRAVRRATTPRETAHVGALKHAIQGDYTKAAEHWDEIAAGSRDLAAVRFAHDIYLHVGDDARRLTSSARAAADWGQDPGWGFVAGQHAFALEEAGEFEEAEAVGWRALEEDPLDLWAVHALAHVYESTNNQTSALSLLRERQETWTQQPALSTHIWWHLVLRLIEGGEMDEVLEIHDQLAPETKAPFPLSDLASMLWRLELAGVDVGDRWDNLANAYANRREIHTVGFLDMHAALAFTRCPDHPGADEFFSTITANHQGKSENDDTFRTVVEPLLNAFRLGDTNPEKSVKIFDQLAPATHRIGGSIAQRDLITRTRSALAADTKATRDPEETS